MVYIVESFYLLLSLFIFIWTASDLKGRILRLLDRPRTRHSVSCFLIASYGEDCYVHGTEGREHTLEVLVQRPCKSRRLAVT